MKNFHSKENKAFRNLWQIQEAKAQFSQLIREAEKKGYQVITKQGEPIAVLLSKQEFDKLTQSKDSLLDFFKSAPCQDVDLNIQRSKSVPRDTDI